MEKFDKTSKHFLKCFRHIYALWKIFQAFYRISYKALSTRVNASCNNIGKISQCHRGASRKKTWVDLGSLMVKI